MAIVPISHDREFECRAGASELCRVIEYFFTPKECKIDNIQIGSY